MRKSTLIVIYGIILLIGAVVITYFVWNDGDNYTITTAQRAEYNRLKEELLHQDSYDLGSSYFTFDGVMSSNKKEVNVSFYQPTANLRNLKILLIDGSEKNNPTTTWYPSVGIVANFNLSLTTSAFSETNKKSIDLGYHINESNGQVLIYIEFNVDDSVSLTKSYLSLQAS